MQRDYHDAERRLMASLRDTPLTAASSDNFPKLWDKTPKAGDDPQDLGYYMPTGNRKLDAILAGARPPIQYGGTNSGVAAWASDAEVFAGDSVIAHGTSWIVQPRPERFASEDARRATLAHELIHWTKEAGRSPRPLTGVREGEMASGYVPPGYAREELVAEIGAALLLDAIGANPQWELRAAYMLNWTMSMSGPEEAETSYHWALAHAERAVDYLLQFVGD